MSRPRLLSTFVKSRWILYTIAAIFIIASNVTQAIFPKVLGDFTDDLEKGIMTHDAVIDYSLLLLGLGVSAGVMFAVGQYLNGRLGRIFEFEARKRLFRHFSILSEHYFSKQGVGKQLSYVMNDVTALREAISRGLNMSVNATFTILSILFMMLISGIPLYLIGFLMLPVLCIPFLVKYFGSRIRQRSHHVQEALAAMTDSAEEQFGGIRLTKTFAAEDIAERRFGERVDEILNRQLRLVRMSSLFEALLPFTGALAFVVAITAGGYMTIQGKISLGNFVTITIYLRMIMGPLQQIGNVINLIQRSRASLDRINALLSLKPDIQEKEGAVALRDKEGTLRIQGLSFKYPDTDQYALQNISLTVKQGRTLGIVGKTGSGKTTLVKLLLRVYDPPERSVYIGEHDIRDVTLQSLRTQIAYVPQDGFLFSTTIQNNIAFSNRNASLDKVEQAAKDAQIHQNISEFPKQFSTVLGERGVTLSGGQRQRTSLARGFMKEAPILILDDSVSAVDAVTETNIIQKLQASNKGQTTLIIAHRISAVKHADEIIVLDEGRVVQRGTHKQLLAEEGLYASLHAIQEEGARHG